MVYIENEAQKKTEILAVCQLCECKIPNAHSCYIDTVKLEFLCKDCYNDTPSISEMEALIEKIRKEQRRWSEKKLQFQPFLPTEPLMPSSVEEVEIEELRV